MLRLILIPLLLALSLLIGPSNAKLRPTPPKPAAAWPSR
jgi:hypothetical protein